MYISYCLIEILIYVLVELQTCSSLKSDTFNLMLKCGYYKPFLMKPYTGVNKGVAV